MVVRTSPLSGPQGEMKISVVVERYRSRNPLRHAQEKFGMSSRELEVLALVLKGFGTPQIAAALDIAELDRARPHQAHDAQDAGPQPGRAGGQDAGLARRLRPAQGLG